MVIIDFDRFMCARFNCSAVYLIFRVYPFNAKLYIFGPPRCTFRVGRKNFSKILFARVAPAKRKNLGELQSIRTSI